MQPVGGQAPYDSLWKALPEEITLALVRAGVPAITAPLIPWRTDLAVVSHRQIDGSFLVDVAGRPCLVHLEYQNYLDNTIPRRMHEYASMLEQQYQQQQQAEIDVVPIVIWAIPGKTPPPIYHREAFGKVLCHREYFEVHLTELDWHAVDPQLLVLAPYLHGVRTEDLADIGVQVYESAPAQHKKTLLAAFIALGQRKYQNFGAIEAVIMQRVGQTMNDIMQDIAESTIGQTLIKQGVIKGISEGKAEGKVEGKAEGKVEGRMATVQIMWQSRFGAMPPEVTAAVQRLPEAPFNELVTRLMGTATEAELRAWLGC